MGGFEWAGVARVVLGLVLGVGLEDRDDEGSSGRGEMAGVDMIDDCDEDKEIEDGEVEESSGMRSSRRMRMGSMSR